MKISVIGTGYVGLVSGACFSNKGFDVTCIDIDEIKIKMLNSGETTIFEPGLKEILQRSIKNKTITFTTDLNKAKDSKVIFICVGTPEGKDQKPDLAAVFEVINKLSSIIPKEEFKVIVTKSTVPVGTGDLIEKIVQDKGLINTVVVSNPEFLKEGDAVNDFLKPDRIIIGANNKQAEEILTEIYSPFTRKENKILIMDRRSAELTKYAANSMLALRITFMNQLANLCEKINADITNIRKGIGTDSRIGSAFLYPGPGYGGSCFPKDVKALIQLSKENSSELSIIEAVNDFNHKQKQIFADKIIKYFNNNPKSRTIAVWGLSFKPETDDIRESPAIEIINQLIKSQAHIKAYDPAAMDNFRKIRDNNNVTYCSSMYDAIKNADALAIITDWNEFKMPDLEKMRKLMKTNIIFDARNLYSLEKMKDWAYISIGRNSRT